jgi:DNA-binding CsgD family transcriptional regulator
MSLLPSSFLSSGLMLSPVVRDPFEWQRLESLTPREVDVLCYLLGGQINREVAAELGITERTVKVHRGPAMEKLGVQSTTQFIPDGVALHSLPRLAEIQTPPKKAQKSDGVRSLHDSRKHDSGHPQKTRPVAF